MFGCAVASEPRVSQDHMKFLKRHAVVMSFLVCTSHQVLAQTNEVEQLKQQLRQSQENFERVQRQQREQIDALTKRLDEITNQQKADAEKKKLEQELSADLQKGKPAATTAQSPPTSTP